MRRLLPVLIIVGLSILHLPSTIVLAGDYQQCETSSTCSIGEFLYNDDYTALPGQSCTLTAKYPDGTAFLTSQAMVDRGDGWYSYNATTGTTEGVYSATICCTPSAGLMCLDKTFEVKAPVSAGSSLTAADVWTYSNRTLTSYGTLVSDIWNASTRSLTTFGSLVSDVWGHSTRTLTSFGTLVTDIIGVTPTTSAGITTNLNTLSAVVAEQQEQRELLEKLVNAPVISLSLDDGVAILDLQTKLDQSKKQAGILYDTLSSAKSRLMILDTKWARLSQSAASSELTSITNLVKDQASLNQLSQSWDTPMISTLKEESTSLHSTLTTLLTSTSLDKTALPPASLTLSLQHLSTMEEILGDSTNSSDDPTFFGYLSFVNDRNSSLEAESQKLAALLENLNGQGESLATRTVDESRARILALNQFPDGASLAEPAIPADDSKLNLKNILFSLQALVGLNRQLLAINVGEPIRGLWLEEGSIIFRAVITNPSTIISQSVPLKFYLPRELKTDDIITLDPSLSTTYDSTEEALYVSGTYELTPGQTKLVFVEVEDIWKLTDQEIQTLRTQASELIKPLEKTSYYSQGITLKSDIDVTLDKVMATTGKAIMPENRIRAYREAKLELTKVETHMHRLQDLVAQASGTGSLFGFVGGVQTIAVWGIILVVVGGFVFLTLYFKKLGLAPALAHSPHSASPALLQQAVKHPAIDEAPHLTPLSLETPPPPSFWTRPAGIVMIVVVTAVTTALLTRLGQEDLPAPQINQLELSPNPTSSSTPTPAPSRDDDVVVESEKSVLGSSSPSTQATLTVPPDSAVNIRNNPSSKADIIMSIKDSQTVIVFDEKGDWSHIGFLPTDRSKNYWIHSQFLSPSAN